MTAGIVDALMAVSIGALAVVCLALVRSARAGTGIWWPLVVAAVVLGGLISVAIRVEIA